jgi:Raf kinase inhibitor-like YbhB/YbcL family protein
MKRIITTLVAVFIFAFASAQTFTLKSNELGGQATNKQVFNGFGCSGENVSPQLFWENAPAGAKSFAITIHDPDAPTGSGWWHWVVFDIPVGTKELKSGAGNVGLKLTPPGVVQSITDFKTQGYGGPCPPEGHGPHRYIVTVYALKSEKLGLDATANPALVGFMLNQNLIEKASLIFYHKR